MDSYFDGAQFAALFASTSSRVLVGADQFSILLLIPLVAGLILTYQTPRGLGRVFSRKADGSANRSEASVATSGEKFERLVSDSTDVMQEQLTKAWKQGEQELRQIVS